LKPGSWPVVIKEGELLLRPLRFRDRQVWDSVREVNRQWLEPWEATRPEIDRDLAPPSYYEMVRTHRRDGKAARSISLGIWLQEGRKEQFIGQITLGGITYGAGRMAFIGYWIDQRFANRGYTTRSVKALTEYGFNQLLLHRIEISMRPENDASKRVAEKSGYYFEGTKLRYLHIDGAWRDHLAFVKENPAVR
jgi:ribosomal-protein-alanine N-acetyltransferase